MRIGLIGLGRLGRAIGERLLDCGFGLRAWNRTPLPEVGRLSTAVVQSIAAVVQDSDCILVVVRDDDALVDVTNQLCLLPIEHKIVVHMGTVRPPTARDVAASLKRHGARFLDAPVSGTVGPARSGSLLFMVGGERSTFDAAGSVFTALGRKCHFLGEAGTASLMKLVVNSLLLVYWQGLGEALAMGKAGGLSVEKMLDVVGDSAAGLPLVAAKAPVILGAAGEVGFDLAGAFKDLGQILAAARELGCSAPATAVTTESVSAALSAGLHDRDVAELVRFLIEQPTRLTQR
ncbi:NAD(P)-dependent oxidoreductase [Bradyrhizobium sp. LjRoot220]|uniref:NAD(P)-dependent oxidoreductase n=1 Tax=Bradyrhizobium sp. LjRoot220 TaxID=3342284 RepID=UPI003ECD86DA